MMLFLADLDDEISLPFVCGAVRLMTFALDGPARNLELNIHSQENASCRREALPHI